MRELTLAVPAANGQGAAQRYYGGWCKIWCWGSDFDSGTVTIQVSPDGGTTWLTAVDMDGVDITFAANGVANFSGAVPDGATVRTSLAGSSGGTAVTCKLVYGWAETRDREMQR